MESKDEPIKEFFMAAVDLGGRIRLLAPSKDVKNLKFCIWFVDDLLAKERKQAAGDICADLRMFELMTGKSIDTPEEFKPFLCLLFESWAQQSQNTYAAAYRLGRERAKSWSTHQNVTRATKGRLKIGATSREKVAAAAQEFRHLSREDASYEMTDIVNLSSGHIRRYLSALFPGDEWKQ